MTRLPDQPAAVADDLRSALGAIRQLKADLKRERTQSREPIAIVGASCRIPGGADSIAEFWALLQDGRDAVCEVPQTRWDLAAIYDPDPARPGKTYSRHAGLLDDITSFDADFFGISPREVEAMDPQHRLALELGWEALEGACIDPRGIRGSSTGVFLGLASADYSLGLLADRTGIDAYVGSGNAHGAAAGRIAYLLGLHGPCLAIDSACSSSLSAVHLAAQSLRLGECDLALAGGLNLLIAPELTINFSKARMLAPDGRCKAFDAAANGYVRGEGGGMVALRRLSDAVANREPILAVIAGSAINHDGATSGLTVPSGPAQERVIRAALAQAGLAPSAIGYVEAHGTGTALGDPIEMNALARVFAGRTAPLHVGSVKTNVGHLEAGAGIAGLLKAALCVSHGHIPASLHWQTLNPHIELADTPIVITARACDWPPTDAPRAAGVSSFGFGGTNAHVVVTAPPEHPPTLPETAPVAQVMVLSARTAPGLAAAAARMAAFLASAGPDDATYCDICFSLQTGRTAFPVRLAVIADGPAAAIRALRAVSDGTVAADDPAVLTGHVGAAPPRAAIPPGAEARMIAAAFVTGQISDWASLWAPLPPRRRRSLPTYPFERRHFWAAAATAQAPSARPTPTPPAMPVGAIVAPTELAGLSAAEQRRWMTDFVRREVARVLHYPPSRLPEVDAGLFELGLDSLMALDLSITFEETFGVTLPETTVIDHPSPAAIAAFLLTRIAAAKPAAVLAASDEDDVARRLETLLRTSRAERAAARP